MRFKRYILLIGLVLCYEANASSNTLLCGVNQEKMFHQLISDTEPEYRHLYQEHIIKLVESAYKGDIESLFDLAESLAHISEDYEKSKCFFEMISERKDDYAKGAMLRLSSYYEYGFNGYPNDYMKHLYWSEKLANLEPSFYENVAFSYYNTASSIENPTNNSNTQCVIQEFSDKAFYWASKSSQANQGKGSIILAQIYSEGLGVKQDYHKAIEYYLLAIKQIEPLLQKNPNDSSAILDISRAYTYLGEAYYAIKDYEQAKHYFEKDITFSEINAFKSYYGLSLLYRHGQGVTKDNDKADELYQKSCELGYVPACENK